MVLTTPHGTAYRKYGPVNAPAVVLIHGLGMHHRMWGEYPETIARSFHVLAYDLGGHGQSTLPTETPSLPMMARQVQELLDHEKIERAALVGFSIGGMINRRVAMDFPDRVSALCILNSPHERGDEAQKLVEQRAADTSSGGPGANLDTTLARWFTPGFLAGNPEYISMITEWVVANDPANYAQFRQVLAYGVKELIRPAIRINVPSLVMTCENDSGSTPAMSHGIAAEIEGSETIIVPDLQHMGLVEKPQLFLDPILEFLGRHA